MGMRTWLRSFNATTPKTPEAAQIGSHNGLPGRKKQSITLSLATMIQAILFRDGLFCLEAVMRGKTTYFRTEARESVLE